MADSLDQAKLLIAIIRLVDASHQAAIALRTATSEKTAMYNARRTEYLKSVQMFLDQQESMTPLLDDELPGNIQLLRRQYNDLLQPRISSADRLPEPNDPMSPGPTQQRTRLRFGPAPTCRAEVAPGSSPTSNPQSLATEEAGPAAEPTPREPKAGNICESRKEEVNPTKAA